MGNLVIAVLILAMATHSSGGGMWCVCKRGLGNDVLQKTLDYACGAGADCTLIHQAGPCFNPNTVIDHCNYAVNSYFQRKGQAPGTCDFSGTASVITSDPSTAGCTYPATASSGTTVTASPTTTNPNTNTPGGTSPYMTNPSNGVLGGGVGTGLGPAGAGMNDVSYGGIRVQEISMFSILVTILFSGIVLLWG